MGSTGATGPAGKPRLLSLNAEAAGVNCTFSGTTLTVGSDLNNNFLYAFEVTGASYNCNGAP